MIGGGEDELLKPSGIEMATDLKRKRSKDTRLEETKKAIA